MLSESIPGRDRVGDENKTSVRDLLERVYSKGELHLVDELVASDFVGYSTESGDAYVGPQGIRKHVIRLRTVFHGFAIETDELHVDDDTFEASWTARGTHERQFLGIDPTCNIGQAGEEPHGNRITVSGIITGTIENRKIHESEMAWDVEGLCYQLSSSVEDAETDSSTHELTPSNPLRISEC